MCQKEQIDQNELLALEKKYETILSNDPASNTFCLLADIQYRLGKVDKATGVLIRGLGYNKNNATARFLLGKIYYDRWLIEQAKKEMKKVLELMPDNLEAAKLLSQIYKSEDNFNKALETLEETYVFHRDDTDIHSQINEIKKELSQIENKSSMQAFETPIESRKVKEISMDDSLGNSEVLTGTMLNLYIEQGQYDKALEIIEHIYKNEEEKTSSIENLEKTKLNKINLSAGFGSKEQ
ncbi:MAG: hypothetical protein E4H21_04900 [Thermodesulfobacteriales bacterium]|nr:MAG: hypothetical protein E4H21_04900 [Thermodesulfobacteriales bacterium]